MAIKCKTKPKRDRKYEYRAVYLTIAGKNLDPYKVAGMLGIAPDSWGKLGEPYGKNRECKQGFWTLSGGPPSWRIDTQMKNILKRIRPVKRRLKKLIQNDETVREACLKICFELPKGIPNACYCFSAELINEFTSLGIDIALSIYVMKEWELIFSKNEQRITKKKDRGALDKAGEK